MWSKCNEGRFWNKRLVSWISLKISEPQANFEKRASNPQSNQIFILYIDSTTGKMPYSYSFAYLPLSNIRVPRNCVQSPFIGAKTSGKIAGAKFFWTITRRSLTQQFNKGRGEEYYKNTKKWRLFEFFWELLRLKFITFVTIIVFAATNQDLRCEKS